MLHEHVEPGYLHTYAKIQMTATFTLPITAKYVPEINMAMKFGTYVSWK